MNDQLNQTDDVFTWKDISILQKENVFKVGTDALLLAAWVPTILKTAKRILDIGTGTGVLSLIMHRAFPGARIIAIDREPAAVTLCDYNFSKSAGRDLLSVSVQDVFSLDTQTRFDLIVCNPPYFFGPNHMHQGPFSGARHAKDNALTWMQKIATLVTAEGHVCVVLPATVATAWIRGGNDHGLFVAHRMNVFSFTGDTIPKRVLLHFTTKLSRPNFGEMSIYNEDDNYTDEYKNLMAGNDQTTLT